MALATLDELKSWISEPTMYADAQLDAILGAASAEIIAEIDPFTGADEYYDGNGQTTLIMRRHPFYAIHAVTVDDVVVTDCELEDGYRLYRELTFPVGTRNVLIEYEAAAVPADLNVACINLARHKVNLQLRTHFVDFPDGGSIGPERAWPADVLWTVSRYRGVSIA